MKSQIALLTLAVCADFYAPHSAWSSVKPEQIEKNSLQYHLDQLTFINKSPDADEVDAHELIQEGNSDASHSLGEAGPSMDDEAEAKDDFRNAIGVEYGIFGSEVWFPVQPQDGVSGWTYNSCNAFFFCSENGVYGGLLNISYVRRLIAVNRHNLDLDVSAGIGWQSPVVKTSISKGFDYVDSYRGGENQFFGLFSVIPTYRLSIFDWLSVGAGSGISYAPGGFPANPMAQDLQAAVKIELGLRPFKNKTLEGTFAFNHRCSFFGALNEWGEDTGSNWYSLGFRKWF